MSRNKGSAFEREIAIHLQDELGLKFKRDLEQYRESSLGDLICESSDWPFLLELKRYARGNGCQQAWWGQANRAAVAAGKRPVVIYKYDRLPIRVCMALQDVVQCIGHSHWPAEDHLIDMTFPAFCYVAREGMCG